MIPSYIIIIIPSYLFLIRMMKTILRYEKMFQQQLKNHLILKIWIFGEIIIAENVIWAMIWALSQDFWNETFIIIH